jgi:hypothetical protein
MKNEIINETIRMWKQRTNAPQTTPDSQTDNEEVSPMDVVVKPSIVAEKEALPALLLAQKSSVEGEKENLSALLSIVAESASKKPKKKNQKQKHQNQRNNKVRDGNF